MNEQEVQNAINQVVQTLHEKEDFDSDDFDSLLNLKIAIEETISSNNDVEFLDALKQASEGNEDKLNEIKDKIADKFNELQEEDKADNMDIDFD